MLLTEYSKSTKWYTPFVDEIFTGITLEDIIINEVDILDKSHDDIVMVFCVELCKSIYDKLLETNNPRDIHIYLASLRIASYDPDVILSSIYKKNVAYFQEYPVLFLMLFSRDNLFKYQPLRAIYEAWQDE